MPEQSLEALLAARTYSVTSTDGTRLAVSESGLGTGRSIILPAAAEITARHSAHAQLSWYAESGHAPFWEEPERFNRELAAFAERC
ncbi:hypothetical protein C5L14_03505 [Labrys okinawensis]|uniref:Alpha/beta hydrolase n=1 Tax=Labrys okinawensis TaxID=346911 RepID=A0A2S9QJV1_9HYPH|nr:alpha/beta hydrolase [Labrys okinawensis]PRH89639.1 hypothetical protein C5L14_03505 [Labrys okinawensis]